jgi:hypothetical protein
MAETIKKRWSKTVERGLELIYSLASAEQRDGQWSQIECATGKDRCDCEQCRNNRDLSEGLAWLESQLAKRFKP